MRSVFVLAVLFGLCDCNGAAEVAPVSPAAATPLETVQPIALSKPDLELVRVGARQALKDPHSAMFGKIVAGRDASGDILVCLMVNAKNSFGGYTGMKPMMGILFDKAPRAFNVAGNSRPDLPQYHDAVVLDVCARKGLQL